MRILTGIQPSGTPHLGNYFGYFKQNMELLGQEENLLMIVDLHALTTVHSADELRKNCKELIKDFLACGFDPKKGTLFFQSHVPEHTELAWILSCVTPVGLIERAVSYKEKVQQGLESNMGLFSYPVLQAADILVYDADTVPVGRDQKQHIEIARDIAQKFNNRYGDGLLTLPEARIVDEVALVPGTDGKKMSKSYGNVIPMFAEEKVIEKAIMGIVTDSKGVDEPKDPENCIVYQLHSFLLDEKGKEDLAGKYRAGGLGYGDAKKMFFADFMKYFGPMRERRLKLKDKDIEKIIKDGAKKAGKIAGSTMERVRKAVGLV
jgi:tryptophanyl-tRNA synthetase